MLPINIIGYRRIQNRVKSLIKGPLIRKVLVLVSGTVLAQGIQILASPLLTRLYNPTEFGYLSVYISILGMVSVVASLRYDTAITLPKDDKLAANLLVLSLIIAAMMSFLMGAGWYAVGDKLVGYLHAEGLKGYLWLMPLSLFGLGLYQTLSFWALRRKDYKALARTRISQSVGQLAIQTGVGFLQYGQIGLLLGDVFSRMGGGGGLAVQLWKKDLQLLKTVTWKKLAQTAYEYRGFPLIASSSAFINSAGLQIVPLMMVLMYGPEVSGWLLLSQRVIGAPMDLVGQSVGQVYIGEGSPYILEKPRSLMELFYSMAKKLFAWGVIPTAVLAVSAPWLFHFVFGGDWREAGTYVQVLAVTYLLKLVIVPLANTLTMLEKLKWQWFWDIGRFILVVSGLELAYQLRFSALQAVVVYSACLSIGYVSLFVLSAAALKRHVSRSENELSKALMPDPE
ncbi:lipopolysaccharide biosynthesis protein [Paenibacillus thalictri]|uniref:Lipopolysaccharide biosynthesis protein n=1 Tax=Paenibacillus thalictri TaxID=2527873 RepID=A0A4Q9DGK8_9BACL|nr:lipopolysaccharide biosynthesis protein [Paenibacillus thalictri]